VQKTMGATPSLPMIRGFIIVGFVLLALKRFWIRANF